MSDLIALARSLIPVVIAAGEIELKYYRADADVIEKLDGSPVTLADQEAETLIAAELKRLLPDVPMVGEESVAAGNIPDISSGRFFLVDPLDGTREFISGGGEFTVNIALMHDFKPVMGIIYAPVSGALYYGAAGEAFLGDAAIKVRTPPAEGITVVASRRHGDPEGLQAFLDARGVRVGTLYNCSSSLKFCAIAEGKADYYPRLGPTSEWDTAAGEAILNAAGGSVVQLDGSAMKYGRAERKFANPHFIASSCVE